MRSELGLSNNSPGIVRQIIKGKSNNDGTRDQDIILVEFEG